MLKCIPRSKQLSDDSKHREVDSKSTSINHKHSCPKSLNSQIKVSSGSNKQFQSCSTSVFDSTARIQSKDGVSSRLGFESSSERFRWSSWRTASFNSVITSSKSFRKNTCGRTVEESARLRQTDPVVYVEEKERKEWDVQVEPGVLITLVSIPPRSGGNDLKRVRFRAGQSLRLPLPNLSSHFIDSNHTKVNFGEGWNIEGSQDMFNKHQAHKWWVENYERVMELFNVKKCSHHVITLLPTNSQEVSKLECRNPFYEAGSSSDSHNYQESTPSLSTTISGVKTGPSSITSTSSRDIDRSEEPSVDVCGRDPETDWVEVDEPGVYVTIRPLPNGRRELLRVRFREQFGERRAREWWEENRGRIHRQYL